MQAKNKYNVKCLNYKVKFNCLISLWIGKLYDLFFV